MRLQLTPVAAGGTLSCRRIFSARIFPAQEIGEAVCTRIRSCRLPQQSAGLDRSWTKNYSTSAQRLLQFGTRLEPILDTLFRSAANQLIRAPKKYD
jgi:hypothetical protein